VKRVSFGPGQTRVIEDWYEQDHSGGLTSVVLHGYGPKGDAALFGSCSRFNYIMHSGATWKGNIDEAKVQIEFEEPKFEHLHAVPTDKWKAPPKGVPIKSFLASRVMWSGFAYPTVDGNRLTFARKDFKPTKRSDVQLEFDWDISS
jgi:hypothetical protein